MDKSKVVRNGQLQIMNFDEWQRQQGEKNEPFDKNSKAMSFNPSGTDSPQKQESVRAIMPNSRPPTLSKNDEFGS